MIQITDMRVHPGDSAFLIDDGKTAILYDSGFGFTGERLADRIEKELGERRLDYIFLTHSHYDHVYGAAYVLEKYPDARVVAGEYAATIFQKPGAKATMRDLDTKMAKSCGVSSYPDLLDRLRVDIPVTDEQEIEAGDMRFLCLHLPGHTKCSFGFYEMNTGLLLACETLGSYNGEGDVVPACLVGCEMSVEAIKRIWNMCVIRILSPHYGVLEGDKVGMFLRRAGESLNETVNTTVRILRNGGTKEEAAQAFKDRYYHGYIPTVYPPDAMKLNTGIMIDLIEREYLSK